MTGRTIAIGDIHGCSDALSALTQVIDPRPDDVLVVLGDFIDRGPDSRKVVDQLIDLSDRCRLIPILGDHEAMLLDALSDESAIDRWLNCGGDATLRAYGTEMNSMIPLADVIGKPHRDFLSSCISYFETDTHFFIHAGYEPDLPLAQQPALALLWRVTNKRTAKPHHSGKTAIVGHSPQRSGKPLDLGFLICIDTNYARGGWLTAIEVNTRFIWQSNQQRSIRVENLRSVTAAE